MAPKLVFLYLTVISLTGLCVSCHSTTSQNPYENYQAKNIILPGNKQIKVYIADNEKSRALGLSKVRQLDDGVGMLFVYPELNYLRFWMKDTYLDLDIFFMDKDLNVIHVERNAPAHPGESEKPPIYRTATIYSQIVLELKSKTPHSLAIKKGDTLSFAK